MKFGDLTEVTFVDAMDVKRRMKEAFAKGDYTLDFDGVERVDSTMIALALHAKRLALAEGKEVTFVNEPESFRELISLYGLEELLPSD